MVMPQLPRISYTSKDFQSLFDDLMITREQYLPEWTDTSDDDYGIQQTKIFCMAVDVLSFYQDRMMNETSPATCVKRQTMISHMRTIGYEMGQAEAASGYLLFEVDAQAGDVLIPAGYRVASKDDSSLSVETMADTVVAGGAVRLVSILSMEGTVYPNPTDFEYLGISTGSGAQSFRIPQGPVANTGLVVAVDDTGTGSAFLAWTRVQTFVGQTPTAQVYTVTVDENDQVTINFGDGVQGMAPTIDGIIGARYRIGGGLIGNAEPNTYTRPLTVIAQVLSVTNPYKWSGGADKESIDHARIAGPASVRANDRLVTIPDYQDIIGNLPGVIEALATDSYPRRVSLYVLPTGGVGSAIPPIVQDTLNTKKMAGVAVRVAGAVGVDLSIRMDIECYANYKQSIVQTNVLNEVRKLFDLDLSYYDRFAHLGTTIPASKIIKAAEVYSGVKRVKLTEFMPVTGTPGTIEDQITIQAYQIAVINPATMPVLTMIGGIV